MTTITQVVGVVLIGVGVVAYVATGAASPTALLPALLGLLILAAGVIATRLRAHQHAIHAALVLALLGALGSLPRVGGIADGEGAAIASLLTVLVCVVYLALGVRSFVVARRARADAGR